MNLHSGKNQICRIAVLAGCIALCSGYAWAQAGGPVPEDSPVFNAFRQLEKQAGGYRMHMEMQASDPRMAQMMQTMGMGGMEKIVKGNTTQTSMRMKIPATDVPGQVDDWEIKAVIRDGRGARIFSTPAAPRLLAAGDRNLAMQMSILERQSGSIFAQALSGPMGGISAGVAAASMALSMAEVAKMSKDVHDFFKWKCIDNLPQQPATKDTSMVSDLKNLSDQAIDGAPHAGYEFYVRDNQNRRQGPVRLYVAKDSGLPKRIEMTDPQGHGTMMMNYEYSAVPEIEVPECLARKE